MASTPALMQVNEAAQGAEYVLTRIRLGRPLNYHSLPGIKEITLDTSTSTVGVAKQKFVPSFFSLRPLRLCGGSFPELHRRDTEIGRSEGKGVTSEDKSPAENRLRARRIPIM